MRGIAITGIVLFLAPVAALVLLVEFQARRPPNISVGFVGYTNDSVGARQASFMVKNFDPSSVLVLAPWVAIQTPTNEVGLGAGHGTLILKAHASTIITIPTPRTEAP